MEEVNVSKDGSEICSDEVVYNNRMTFNQLPNSKEFCTALGESICLQCC